MDGLELFETLAHEPSFGSIPPRMGAFLRDYLAGEKPTQFNGRVFINTHLPPYPSRAFDRMLSHFAGGENGGSRLFSVTLAVTNRCPMNCWHCYNAGREETDVPLEVLRRVARELQDLGTAVVTLTGGEPLIRDDLEEIADAFDERTSLVLGTTGLGLTAGRADALARAGIAAVGVSLDSADRAEHDRLRGMPGAFDAALAALETAGDAGLYPYVVSVATREFLEAERFHAFMRFVRESGAREVHLLEPVATGRLAGRSDITLTGAERRTLTAYQREYASRHDMPAVSSLVHIESGEVFGCGAGLTHLYIDGAGNVCPCNLVPLSFGNITDEPLAAVLDRMGRHFGKPRTACTGRVLSRFVGDGPLPLSPGESARLCDAHLPENHPLPRFFELRETCGEGVGAAQLREAYDRVHGSYDEFWLTEAAAPVDALLEALDLCGDEKIFEAGCGTGYATAAAAGNLADGHVTAVDISEGMLAEARRRCRAFGNITFHAGDALELLEEAGPFDVVMTTWVLGYISLSPFFKAAARALGPGGRLAFVVHRDGSPREPLEIFSSLVAEDPGMLTRAVDFDFPRDAAHVGTLLDAAGFEVESLAEGAITFRYRTGREVLEHLLKSGAGTAFYDAVAPEKRPALECRFVERLGSGAAERDDCPVTHEYICCIACR